VTRFSLEGKRALISGGSRGIGFGIAKAMAEVGAEMVLVARDATRLQQARAELEVVGNAVGIHSFDLQDIEAIPHLYEEILSSDGPIDILVNNAGLTRRGPAEEVTLDDWNLVMEVNVTAVFVLCQALPAKESAAASPGGSSILPL